MFTPPVCACNTPCSISAYRRKFRKVSPTPWGEFTIALPTTREPWVKSLGQCCSNSGSWKSSVFPCTSPCVKIRTGAFSFSRRCQSAMRADLSSAVSSDRRTHKDSSVSIGQLPVASLPASSVTLTINTERSPAKATTRATSIAHRDCR